MYYKYIKVQNKEDTHKDKKLMVSMLLTLPEVKRYFKGSKMYRSTVKHKKQKKKKKKKKKCNYCYSYTYQLQQYS